MPTVLTKPVESMSHDSISHKSRTNRNQCIVANTLCLNTLTSWSELNQDQDQDLGVYCTVLKCCLQCQHEFHYWQLAPRYKQF